MIAWLVHRLARTRAVRAAVLKTATVADVVHLVDVHLEPETRHVIRVEINGRPLPSGVRFRILAPPTRTLGTSGQARAPSPRETRP